MRRAVLRALLALPVVTGAAPARAQDLTVFAAASLQNALEEIGALYRRRHGQAIRFSFASSGTLARQIERDGPAAVFLSADEQWMDYLEKRALIDPGSRKSLLGNRLVLVVPVSNPVTIEPKQDFEFAAVLGKDGRWVTGDPTNVPVGRYAQDALTHLGVWSFAQSRLVRAENVRVALAFVERGEAVAGIVYETDAVLSRKVRIAGVFPAASHAPISYPVAIVAKNDTPAARAFVAHLQGDAAAQVFRKFGFSSR